MSFIFQPNAGATLITSVSKTLSATGTVLIPVFSVTGTVRIYRLWGEVTTVLNSAITNAYFESSDGVATPDITFATGATLSALPVGSVFQRTGLAATALSITNPGAAPIVRDPAAAGTPIETMFEVTKSGVGATNIQFAYTKDAGASSGVIQFFAEWLAVSANGALGVL